VTATNDNSNNNNNNHNSRKDAIVLPAVGFAFCLSAVALLGLSG